MKRILLRNILVISVCFSLSNFAETKESVKPPLKFKAKRHFQDLNKGFTILEGNAKLSYGTSKLSAGKVVLDKNKSQITATENVLLDIPSEQTYIKAHELIYNFATRKGELINAEVKSGFSKLRAKKMRKVGEKQYRMFKGTYTTCEVSEDEYCPWKIWSHEADVTLGGYVTAEHPVFLAGGVPIFYSPFFFFPIKTERQSGFLIPDFAASEHHGVQVKNSLFLALGRSHDATASFEYLSKRGFKEGLEYRYVLNDMSKGYFNGYFMRDRESFKDFGFRRRYAATYDHSLYFTPNLFNKTSVRLVSDDEYVKDFQKDIEGRSDPGLETKVLQGLNTDHVNFNLEAIYYQSLLSEKPQGSNKEITHKLPEFRMDILPFEYLFPLSIGANLSFVNFFNEKGYFKDTNGNGKYDEGTDKILRAYRSDVFPQISLPIKMKRYFEFIPRFGARQTHWWLPIGDKNKNRFMLDIGSSFSTNVQRIFNYGGKKIQKIKHLIQPSLSYNYTPLVRGDNVFHQFDGVDKIGTVNALSWGLQHRFIFKQLDEKEEVKYFDGIRFDMTQQYDFIESRKKEGTPHPLSDLKNVLSANLGSFSLKSEADYNFYGDKVTKVSNGVQYTDPLKNIYRLNYTYSKNTESNTINGGIGFNFIEILKFNFSLNYSFDKNQFLEKIYQAVYFPRSKCWALNLNFEDKRDSGFTFTAGVNLLFGENFLSVAKLYQAGESQNLRLFGDQGSGL